MQIAQIKIENFMGIEFLEFDAGRFNLVEAANGKGKTSIMQALRMLIDGGEDATLLRKGAKKGEVVIVLNDGTKVSRRLTEKSIQPLVIEKDGVKVSKPASVMKALTDAISTNPIEFLRARKKDRVDILLDSLPIEVSAARLTEIVGHPVTLNPNQAPFDQIDTLRQSIFDDRTGTNRALNDKRATIDQLSRTLPDTDVEAPPEDETGLLAAIDDIDRTKDAEIARVNGKLDNLRTAFEAAKTDVRATADTDIAAIQDQVRALEAQITERRAKLASDLADEIATFQNMEAAANKQKQKTLAEHAVKRGGVSGSLDGIRQRSQQAAKHQQTRDTIATMDDEATALQSDSDRQSGAIAAIDAYKSELLSTLPVRGLEVRNGEILRDGIVFERLNTAQQIGIAVEIAKLRVGELAIMCLDGIELLDDASLAELQEQTLSAGLQAFVTKVVPSGELEISAIQ